MDQVILPFVFIPDGQDLPDLSQYRDPIILRALFEAAPKQAAPAARPSPPPPAEAQTETDAERLHRIDPPIQPVYPEAWLLGGLAATRLGLAALRAIARRVLPPEPAGPPATADRAATQQRAPEAPSRPAEPISLD